MTDQIQTLEGQALTAQEIEELGDDPLSLRWPRDIIPDERA